jgi:hypothetical protein
VNKTKFDEHTPQAWAISFVSHHFDDEFGQSIVKPPVIKNTRIVEITIDTYILSEMKSIL